MLNNYVVIARDFYREHEPMMYHVSSNNEDEANNIVFRNDNIKEILDIKLSGEIDWDDETKEKYWLMYASQETIDIYKNN